jgi:hypothetical protein
MTEEVTYILPVIPPPPEGEVAIITAVDGYTGPFFRGDGPINLRCGRCMHLLVYHLHPGQIINLVLKCSNSKCGAYNAIISVPTVENLIGRLQDASSATVAQLPDLAQILGYAQKHKIDKEKLFTGIREYMPEFAWIEKLIVPQSPGDFYGLMGFLIALLSWYQAKKPSKRERVKKTGNDFLRADK